MTCGLVLDDLRIALAGRALVALNTAVAPGQILTVMGASGSGKSTLLMALIGATPVGFAVSGRVILDGRDLTGLGPRDRGIGLLFQDDLLFPHLSVGGNLAFAIPARVRGHARRRAAVTTALGDAGLAGFTDRDPATLSGGQRARVALMRTLLAEPLAVLLDEPFSRLDAGLRDQVRGFTFDTVRARGLPTLLVTHDDADAAAAGGRVVDPMGRSTPVISDRG